MAPDYKSYLTAQIVAEKNTVSYRNVSRALKVHVNAAKCMLYEFHERENKKKPGSVYATYLIAGTKKRDVGVASTNGAAHDADHDEPMPSSPPPFTSSMLEPSQQSEPQQAAQVPVYVKTVSLVREEAVDAIQQQYESISSIHVYSLSPGRLQDLVTLTDIGRDLFSSNFVKGDPLIQNKDYGVIQNSGVRRRKGKRPIIPDVPIPKSQATKTEKPAPHSTEDEATDATRNESRPGSRDSASSSQAKQPVAHGKQHNIQGKHPSLKRDGSSLFKAFAKQSSKSSLERKDTDGSTNGSASGAEDVKMADADEEGESEDEALFLDTKTRKTGTKKRSSDVLKERADKAAKLRKMMDSDDEEEKAVPNVEDATGVEEDPPAAMPGAAGEADPEGKEDVEWSASDSEKPKSQSVDQPDAAAPKRRRGKRKVMKKRTMKDEDGYLVTKEEPVWESFSEDEPEPVKEKQKNPFGSVKNQSSQKSSTAPKDGATKKKGNIMSFFGKK